jgi:hypothetical protein
MSEREEWINKLLKGCEHDGSYVPVSEVERLMRESRKQGAVEELENQLLWINQEIKWYSAWEEGNVLNEYNVAQRKCLERIKEKLIINRLKELKEGVEK